MRFLHLVGLSLVVFGTSGCQFELIRSTFAHDHACRERVTVKAIPDTDRYRAEGCGRKAVYDCSGGACVAADDTVEPEMMAAEPPPARPAPTAQRVSKKGKALLTLDLPLDAATVLKFRSVPDKSELVQVKLTLTGYSDATKECELAWMVNGQRIDVPKPVFTSQPGQVSYRSDVTGQLVQELALARQFALRTCDRRWSLTPQQIAQVHQFIGMYQEDLAWKRPPSSGGSGGRMAPAGGWPSWQVATDAPIRPRGKKPLQGEALFKLLSPSVFSVEASVESGHSQGSAVAVTAGELLTNCHVVEGAQKIVVRQGKREWPGTLLRADPATDRCVLKIPEATLTPVAGVRTYGDLDVGEALFTVGSPNGLERSFANGVLAGLRTEEGRPYVQTTAPISPGSSGGGLFDAYGNIVGITTMVLLGTEHINQSLNFAIPADSYWKP